MSPLAETLILILVAIFALFLVILVKNIIEYARGKYKKEKFLDASPEQPEKPEEPRKEEPLPPSHPSERVQIVFAQPIPSRIHNGKTLEYEILPKVFSTKDGKKYQVLKSSSGAVFFVNENNTRRYLSKEEINSLKDI